MELGSFTTERVDRVAGYHQATKHRQETVRKEMHIPDWTNQPKAYRSFPDHPRVQLPTKLLGAHDDTLAILREGLAALPESYMAPPKDLRTLASWLHMADGLPCHKEGNGAAARRTSHSNGSVYPCEIYVAAFAISDVEPGLYHYNPCEFALRRLRGVEETACRIKRARPEFSFVQRCPAVLLVSTIFWRAVWRYRDRGYRSALLDTGHMVENLVVAAKGMGMQTMTWLSMNDLVMRELIGVGDGDACDAEEAVHAMVLWDDLAGDATNQAQVSAAPAQPERLAAIKRHPLSGSAPDLAAILAAHRDCVAEESRREIREPLTELSPLPAQTAVHAIPRRQEAFKGLPLHHVLSERGASHDFVPCSIPVDSFVLANELAFAGGTYAPLFPKGRHAALVRPFWLISAVSGMAGGIWYFNPGTTAWSLLREGDVRADAKFLCFETDLAGHAAAVCFMAADLKTLMAGGGTDAYRLAHIEAGIAGHRFVLASKAAGLGCATLSLFYDDEVRRFLGMEQTGWEVIYAVAVGVGIEES